MGGYSWKHKGEIRTILKVGHSFMVAIPPACLERLKLKKGDEVLVTVDAPLSKNQAYQVLIVQPLPKEQREGER